MGWLLKIQNIKPFLKIVSRFRIKHRSCIRKLMKLWNSHWLNLLNIFNTQCISCTNLVWVTFVTDIIFIKHRWENKWLTNAHILLKLCKFISSLNQSADFRLNFIIVMRLTSFCDVNKKVLIIRIFFVPFFQKQSK